MLTHFRARRVTVLFGVMLLVGCALVLTGARPVFATTLFSDSFTDSNGTPLPTHNPAWTTNTGTAFSIQNNAAATPDGNFNKALVDVGTPNGTVQATIFGYGPGLLTRASDFGHSFLIGRINGSYINFTRFVNDNKLLFRVLGAHDGEVLQVITNGQHMVVKQDGVVVGTWTDTRNATATGFGMESFSQPSALDDFSVTDSVADNPGTDVTHAPLIIFDGDSRMASYALTNETDRLTNKVIALVDPAHAYDWLNQSQAAQSQTTMTGNAPDQIDALLDPQRPEGKSVVFTWGGANDFEAGTSPQAVHDSIRQYCLDRHAAGFKCAVLTILPFTFGNVDYEPQRTQLNALLRADWTTFADALVDIGADPTIGQAGQQNNTTYYLDQLHLTGAGNTIAAGYIQNALKSLLAPPASAPTAQSVYGQPDAVSGTANNGGISRTSVSQPHFVATDSANGLYVSDFANNRVLHYPANSTTADRVYGQAGNFTTACANGCPNGNAPSAGSLNRPEGVAVAPDGGLYISDGGNHRILYYPAGSTTPGRVYGAADYTGGACSGGNTTFGGSEPLGVAVAPNGDLYVADTNNNRVLYFPAPQIGDPTSCIPATRVYGQPDFVSNSTNNGGSGAANLNQPYGVAVGSDGSLYVSDQSNQRVLHYPVGATTADRVYGSPDFTTSTVGGGRYRLNFPAGLTVDPSGGLYVADSNNNRVLYYAPFQNGDAQTGIGAIHVYGQSRLNANDTNAGGLSAASLGVPLGVALDGTGTLYIADSANNRLLTFPAGANGTVQATLFNSPVGTMTSDSIVQRGEDVIYTLDLTNTSTTQAATGVQVSATFANVTVVPGSVTINGVPKTAADPSDSTKTVRVGTIPAGATAVVRFVVAVDGDLTDGTTITEQTSYSYDGAACGGGCASNSVSNVVNSGPDPLAARIIYAHIGAATDGRVGVEWATALETRNLGFVLTAFDAQGVATRLTPHIIPAHAALDQPDGLYSTTVSIPSGTLRIAIDDVEPGGKTTRHGAYPLGTTIGTQPTYTPRRTTNQPASGGPPPTHIALVQTDAALSVTTDGIYHLDYAALAAQGIDLTGVAPAKLGLSSGGANVPLYVRAAKAGSFNPGDYIEFAATALDTFYSGANVYVLTARPANPPHHLAQPPSVSQSPKGGSAPAKTATRILPGRRYYWSAAPVGAHLWNWALLENDIPALADQSVTFDLPALYNTGRFAKERVKVVLALRGWNGYAAFNPDHHAVADLAGAHGEVTFNDNDTATLTLSLPASALLAAGNTLRLRAPGDIPGVQYDTMILDSISVTYPQATAVPPSLTGVAGVRAFNRAADVQAAISAQAGGTALDYIAISPANLMTGVAPLVAQHRAEGLRVATVDVNAVYDVYSNGVADPAAIKTFIAALAKGRGLRYVVLVGADSTDPRGYITGDAPSLIPAFRNPDSFGAWAASDAAYADVDGDGLPDVALGRLPVHSSDELAAIVAKSAPFAAGSGPALFANDPSDAAFGAVNRAAAARLPKGAAVIQVSWAGNDPTPARATLVAQWPTSRIVTFTGHSNADVWADDVLLDASAVNSVARGPGALVAVWGCWAATFDSSGSTGLSAALLATAQGGAFAVVGNSTEVPIAQNAPAAAQFYSALYAGGTSQPIGLALLRVKRSLFAAHSDWHDLAAGLTLLGDPAARV